MFNEILENIWKTEYIICPEVIDLRSLSNIFNSDVSKHVSHYLLHKTWDKLFKKYVNFL